MIRGVTNRRNIHHRPALLSSFCNSDAGYKTPDLLTYLFTYLLIAATMMIIYTIYK